INFADAKAACESAGFKLITESQWLAIAWNASQQACNWNTGIVGKGRLAQGLRNKSVNEAQPGMIEPEDPDEQRWLTLSNGERICDLNGNVLQWVSDDIQGDEGGLTTVIKADSPSLTTAPYPSNEKGMGWRPDGERDWSGRALIRGGGWDSGRNAGAFYLDVDWPGSDWDSIGFRCTL
ncbi:MAG: SUMF1/EgtB/PvdO family nonheme iron enzyme, partial [Azonexus sp.]